MIGTKNGEQLIEVHQEREDLERVLGVEKKKLDGSNSLALV
jgi:hypothetical protein